MQSVQQIYNYYKKFGHKTEVMGASFRNIGEIIELAGCDLLTISPDLLRKLADSNDKVERKLSPEAREDRQHRTHRPSTNDVPLPRQRRRHGDRKAAEGIRKFAADIVKLEKLIEALK